MLQNDEPNALSIFETARKAVKQKDTAPLIHKQVEHPLWLLFVIEDLTQFCKKNNLRQSREALKMASLVLENEISQQKKPEVINVSSVQL